MKFNAVKASSRSILCCFSIIFNHIFDIIWGCLLWNHIWNPTIRSKCFPLDGNSRWPNRNFHIAIQRMNSSARVPSLQKDFGSFLMHFFHYSLPTFHLLLSVYPAKGRVLVSTITDRWSLSKDQTCTRIFTSLSVEVDMHIVGDSSLWVGSLSGQGSHCHSVFER